MHKKYHSKSEILCFRESDGFRGLELILLWIHHIQFFEGKKKKRIHEILVHDEILSSEHLKRILHFTSFVHFC